MSLFSSSSILLLHEEQLDACWFVPVAFPYNLAGCPLVLNWFSVLRNFFISSRSAFVISASHLSKGQEATLSRVLVGIWHPQSLESVKASVSNGPQDLVA